MNINPFEALDRLLEDYASPHARRVFHGVLTLVVALVGIWFAANEDWKQFFIALGVAVYTYANKANTDSIPSQPTDHERDHALWAEQPAHVDDIVPRTTEHDASDLYGDGADRGGEVSGNPIPDFGAPEGRVNPPNRGWQ